MAKSPNFVSPANFTWTYWLNSPRSQKIYQKKKKKSIAKIPYADWINSGQKKGKYNGKDNLSCSVH